MTTKFSLKDKVEFKPKTYDNNEQAKLLEGYTEVPKEEWQFLERRLHVRYLSIKGFRRGGFILSNYEKNGKKFLLLHNKLNPPRPPPGVDRMNFDPRTVDPKYARFPVAFEDLIKVWKKPLPPSRHELSLQNFEQKIIDNNSKSRTGLFSEMSSLELRIETMEESIDELRSQNRKMLQFIFRKFKGGSQNGSISPRST